MKNLKDCILNEGWTAIDHKPAFAFTPNPKFKKLGYDIYDNPYEIEDFFNVLFYRSYKFPESDQICEILSKTLIQMQEALDKCSSLLKGEDKNLSEAYEKLANAFKKAYNIRVANDKMMKNDK